MNVREALEKKVGDSLCGRCSFNPCRACIADEVKRHFVEGIAPIIERALRAAYGKGHNEACLGQMGKYCGVFIPERGVTAGVAAMVEKS